MAEKLEHEEFLKIKKLCVETEGEDKTCQDSKSKQIIVGDSIENVMEAIQMDASFNSVGGKSMMSGFEEDGKPRRSKRLASNQFIQDAKKIKKSR